MGGRSTRAQSAAVVLGAVAATLAATLGAVLPAAAHETASTITPVVDGFEPAAGGVEAFVQASQDATLLTLVPEPGVVVEVLDEDGAVWARVTAEGVEADLSNPSYHAGTNARGAVPDPLPTVGAGFTQVSREGRFQWFEHRLHPSGLQVPAEVLSSGIEQDVSSWEVPLRIDGVDTQLRGRLRHVPVVGSVVPRLLGGRQLAPGITIDVVPGAVPGFLLLNDSDVAVTVLSRDGAPYVVVDGDGAAVNIASATWAEQRRIGAAEPLADTPVTEGVTFVRLSATASHSWLDPRAALPGVLPSAEVRDAGREVVLTTWSIPVQVGDQLVAVDGETVWVPLASAGAAAAGGAGDGLRWDLVVALSAAVVIVMVVLRRRGRAARG